jgi:beta-galactosidase
VPINGTTTACPAYYRAVFHLDKTGDTFLGLSNWKKGMVYVNGHNIGRFWEIGHQQLMYSSFANRTFLP